MTTTEQANALHDIASQLSDTAALLEQEISTLTADQGTNQRVDDALGSLRTTGQELHDLADVLATPATATATPAVPNAPTTQGAPAPAAEPGTDAAAAQEAAAAAQTEAGQAEADKAAADIAATGTVDEQTAQKMANAGSTTTATGAPAGTLVDEGPLPLYLHDGPDLVADATWPVANVRTPEGATLYHYVQDTPGGAAAGDGQGSGVWHAYTGPTVEVPAGS